MSTTSQPREQESTQLESEEQALVRLRELLLTPEQSQLEQLQQRLDNPVAWAKEVSQILPEALGLRIQQTHQKNPTRDLTQSLTPYVEEVLQSSVKKNPQFLVDLLFPIMGAAIRRSLSATVAQLLQTLNQAMEYSFSPKGVGWRMEALRTGRPFAEVILLRTLQYRVEQIFLIHRTTGLLLHHEVAAAVIAQDAQMVSGMLTAIQDFVRDSFDIDQEGTLATMQVGELTVWIEQGPQALLAGVIRGTAPLELRRNLQETLEQLHQRYHLALCEFQGDTTAFATVDVSDCFVAQYGVQKSGPPRLALGVLGVVGVLLLGLGFNQWQEQSRWQRWQQWVEQLDQEVGVVVVASERRANRYYLSALYDPLGPDPARLLKNSGFAPQEVWGRWERYQSLEPTLVLKRAKQRLNPPPTVQLRLIGDTLYIEGSPALAWIRTVEQTALQLPGIQRIQVQSTVP